MVENRRLAGNKVVQRHVLYPGELNDSQQRAWERTIAVFDEQTGEERQMALFPADRALRRRAKRRACKCDSMSYGCPTRDSGARAGWLTTYGGPCSWMSFFKRGCR